MKKKAETDFACPYFPSMPNRLTKLILAGLFIISTTGVIVGLLLKEKPSTAISDEGLRVRTLYFPPFTHCGQVAEEIESSLKKYPDSIYAINGVLFPFAPRVLYKRQTAQSSATLDYDVRNGLDRQKVELWLVEFSPEAVRIEIGAEVEFRHLLELAVLLHSSRTNILLSSVRPGFTMVLTTDTAGPHQIR